MIYFKSSQGYDGTICYNNFPLSIISFLKKIPSFFYSLLSSFVLLFMLCIKPFSFIYLFIYLFVCLFVCLSFTPPHPARCGVRVGPTALPRRAGTAQVHRRQGGIALTLSYSSSSIHTLTHTLSYSSTLIHTHTHSLSHSSTHIHPHTTPTPPGRVSSAHPSRALCGRPRHTRPHQDGQRKGVVLLGVGGRGGEDGNGREEEEKRTRRKRWVDER